MSIVFGLIVRSSTFRAFFQGENHTYQAVWNSDVLCPSFMKFPLTFQWKWTGWYWSELYNSWLLRLNIWRENLWFSKFPWTSLEFFLGQLSENSLRISRKFAEEFFCGFAKNNFSVFFPKLGSFSNAILFEFFENTVLCPVTCRSV